MWQKLLQIWKVKDVRKSIFFVLMMLVIYRFAANIPIPGIDPQGLRAYFDSNQFLGLINVFSGGGISNFSIVAMGVAPYITSSIIFQLLAMIVPKIEAMSQEPDGRQRINKYTRLATVPLAILQSYGLITLFRQSQLGFLDNISAFQITTIIVFMTAGTVFLMWLGELISEKRVGNGISLIIFAGIISSLPQTLQRSAFLFDRTQLVSFLVFAALAVVTIIGVVFITEGQRNIPVSYARQVRGRSSSTGGARTFLPLRVNQAGVIPIIFAISLILFPPLIAQFFLQAKSEYLVDAAQWVITLFQNQTFYGILYFVLVVGFTYFYTAVVFHPTQIAENLQKQGGFIPGIRPGTATSGYLENVMTRITLVGALFLGVIAILPLVTQQFFAISTLTIGGTSLLIVVSVVIESLKQIDAQLTMRDYEGF
ncbi:MAG TPA: preprotein translocase subunit SecY [Patescibacteria group bacterium]|nr:preprotein translocase subunit SecY [Patescibacteria group bacterium]